MSSKPPAGSPGDLGTLDLGPTTGPSGATLDSGALPAAGALPAPRRLGRFELLELLGRGAMGSVYKALDPRLGRSVALKLLRAGAGTVERFLREARAQARVDHPNVCKVFEADLIGGEPYIAMQLIAGETLGSAAASMGVEEKVAVLRLVAEGLHAAHRQGLIHRDVKPSNVMVARDEGRGFTAYVMDFGLARLDDVRQTADGSVLGTPAYMAPEQARGDDARVDRRTDVYGLGATLYHVLVGRPPFDGDSVSAVLLQVLQAEPTPPRRVVPSVPGDLETIVLKCLEKEPQRRYESARALAEDLGRFLDGEPVAARPAGLLYRLGKRARKHKAIAAALLASTLVVAASAGLLARESWRAAARERLAARYAEVGRDMEAVMERSRLLPLHDVTYARAIVQQKMDAVRADMASAGDLALGPGRYALGRGFLALGDYGAARRELEAAWAGHGAREKGVDYSLGVALVELYRVELAAAQRISDPCAKRERLAVLDRDLRQPALAHLRAGREAGASPEYAEALLAFLDHDYERAIEKARAAEERSPWLYAASLLAADAWLSMGTARRDEGRGADARRAFEEAEALYRAAARKGGSDPRCYEGIAQLRLDEMYLELIQTGRPLDDAFDGARAACRQALTADPARAVAWSLMSSALFRRGQDLAGRGEDAAPAYREAVAAAEKAVSLDPGDENAFKSLGNSETLFGLYEYGFDRPAAPLVEKGVLAYESAIRIDPANPALRSNLGYALDLLPFVQRAPDRSAVDTYRRRAESSFREAVRLAPGESDYWNNLGGNLLKQGMDRSERSEDPVPHYAEAVKALDQAVRLNPENTSAYNNLGYVSELQGEHEMYQLGRDPRPTFARAISAFEEVLRRNPRLAVARNNLADTLYLRALYERGTGLPWQESLRRARESYRESLRANDEDYGYWLGLARTWTLEGDERLRAGESADEAVAGAERAIRKAEALAPGGPSVLVARAGVDMLKATRAIALGAGPGRLSASAEAALQKAAALEPDSADWQVDLALALEPWSAWQLAHRPAEAAATIARGTKAARRALELSAGQPEAAALLASFLEMQSRGERDPARRAALLAEARDALGRALEHAPFLARERTTLKLALGLP